MALGLWSGALVSTQIPGAMMSLVLASASPRRRDLLASLGVEFNALAVDIDESVRANEAAYDYVLRLAIEKAQAALNGDDRTWVLGSDTSVVVDNQILGKPTSKAHFADMMRQLSGRTHQVMTSVALVSSQQVFTDVVISDVSFIELSDQHIEQYWLTNEPADKAGGYGIQGFASVFVQQIRGSYSAVVGLPLHETTKILSKAGLPVWNGALLLNDI